MRRHPAGLYRLHTAHYQRRQGCKISYNVNSVTQAIGEAIFGSPQLLEGGGHSKLIEAREDLYQRILALQKKYPVLERVCRPQTNFVFLKVAAKSRAAACAGEPSGAAMIFRQLLDRSIAVRHMGEYLRISAGSPEENAAVDRALDEILRNM